MSIFSGPGAKKKEDRWTRNSSLSSSPSQFGEDDSVMNIRGGASGTNRTRWTSGASVEPVEPVELVEPVEPGDPVKPTKPVKPVEPVEPVEPQGNLWNLEEPLH